MGDPARSDPMIRIAFGDQVFVGFLEHLFEVRGDIVALGPSTDLV